MTSADMLTDLDGTCFTLIPCSFASVTHLGGEEVVVDAFLGLLVFMSGTDRSPPSAVLRQDTHCLAGIDGDAGGVDVRSIPRVFVIMSCADMVMVLSREAFVFCQ